MHLKVCAQFSQLFRISVFSHPDPAFEFFGLVLDICSYLEERVYGGFESAYEGARVKSCIK